MFIGRDAEARTFAVDTVADEADAATGDGACATASGACSLRAATTPCEANFVP